MAGLNSYDDLKNEIQLWLEREGEPALVDRLPTIIQLAEAWMNRQLRGYQREVTGTVETDTAGKVALPLGATRVKSVSLNGRPYRFALSGNTLTIAGAGAATFDIVYMSKLAPLSGTNQTNWLLQEAPDVYLSACLSRASLFSENLTMGPVYESQAQAFLSELNSQGVVAQYGQESLTIPGPVP